MGMTCDARRLLDTPQECTWAKIQDIADQGYPMCSIATKKSGDDHRDQHKMLRAAEIIRNQVKETKRISAWAWRSSIGRNSQMGNARRGASVQCEAGREYAGLRMSTK